MGTLYLRGKTWWIQYHADGRRYQESSKSKRKMVAKRLLEQREGAIAEGREPGIRFDKTKFDELKDDFLRDYRVTGKKSLERAKISAAHLAEFFEGIPGNPPNLVEQASRDGVNGVWKGDLLNRRKDGRLINVHISLTWLFDEDNIPTGCVGITTDITGRIKMEKELLEANRALKKLDRLKSDFLTSTSHEFRTPLTSITSFVDILLNGEEEEEARKILNG